MRPISWALLIIIALPPQHCFASIDNLLAQPQPFRQRFTDLVGYTSPQRRIDKNLSLLKKSLEDNSDYKIQYADSYLELYQLRNFLYGNKNNPTDNVNLVELTQTIASRSRNDQRFCNRRLYPLLALLGSVGGTALPIKAGIPFKFILGGLEFLALPALSSLGGKLKDAVPQMLLSAFIVIAGGYIIKVWRSHNKREQDKAIKKRTSKFTKRFEKVMTGLKSNVQTHTEKFDEAIEDLTRKQNQINQLTKVSTAKQAILCNAILKVLPHMTTASTALILGLSLQQEIQGTTSNEDLKQLVAQTLSELQRQMVNLEINIKSSPAGKRSGWGKLKNKITPGRLRSNSSGERRNRNSPLTRSRSNISAKSRTPSPSPLSSTSSPKSPSKKPHHKHKRFRRTRSSTLGYGPDLSHLVPSPSPDETSDSD